LTHSASLGTGSQSLASREPCRVNATGLKQLDYSAHFHRSLRCHLRFPVPIRWPVRTR